MPNIENDLQEFEAKTRLVVRNASACMTLTGWARERVTAMVAESLERPVAVLPHGFAVEPGRYPTGRRLGDHSAVGVYGALRPNRALDAVAAAWRALARRADRDERVGLKILLRSVSASDVGRYAHTLSALIELIKEGLNVDLRVAPAAVSDTEIVDFHRTCSVILLPYRWVTHSGQLELCFDLGVPVLVPRIGGLESQVMIHPRASSLVTWFDGSDLSASERLASLMGAAIVAAKRCHNSIGLPAAYRREEHDRLVRYLRAAYLRPMPARPDGSDNHD